MDWVIIVRRLFFEDGGVVGMPLLRSGAQPDRGLCATEFDDMGSCGTDSRR